MFRRILAIMIFFVLFAGSAGFYLVFKVEQHLAKEHMELWIKEHADLSSLTKIAVAKERVTHLQWEEQDKELWHKGMLMDIVQTHIEGDSVFFYGIEDKRETEVFKKLSHLQQNSDGKKTGDAARRLLHLFFSLYAVPSRAITWQAPQFASGAYFTKVFNRHLHPYILGSTPPPWM